MRDTEEAPGKSWLTYIGIIVEEEDVICGLIVGGDVAAEFNLRLQDGAGHILGLDGVRLEVKAQGGGCVRDTIVDHIIGLRRREVRKSAGHQ